MAAQTTVNVSAPGIPDIPVLASEILLWSKNSEGLEQNIESLVNKYPVFFQRILSILSNNHDLLNIKTESIYQAVQHMGVVRVTQAALIQIIYRTFSQYKIMGVDLEAFWQASLRRAVSAKMLGELTGLDGGLCFSAGFMQDIGFLLLFLEQPKKGVLWAEFYKREPLARLSMEENIFNAQHDMQLHIFLQSWQIFPDIQNALVSHHNSNEMCSELSEQDLKLSRVLHCADWMSAVFTVDDKSYAINQCSKILRDDFKIQVDEAQRILESIPCEVDSNAEVLGMQVKRNVSFSEILFKENIRLNENYSNFQELTSRLDQAIYERDRLAEELNRDLNLAREIQKSLLPVSQGNNYPINGINISAKILSGDFYDYFELENGDIYFNLGDVSGKGVNAALLMAKTCSLFRGLGKRIDDPGKLLYEINNELCETSIHGMFVTMVAGLYSPAKDEVRLVNAGNPPALLLSESGICEEFEATAPPLGIMPDTIYTEYKFNLNSGSLYIYSDGVTEGYIDENRMLELSGLFKMISSLKKNTPPIDRLNSIVNNIVNNEISLRDDVTLLLLENN